MTAEFSSKLNDFNTQISTLATSQTNANSKVITVDMFTGFNDNYLADDVHYNLSGALFIANRYYTAISNEFNNTSTLNILTLGDSRVEGGRP